MNKKIDEFFDVQSEDGQDEPATDVVEHDTNQTQLVPLESFDKEMDDISDEAIKSYEEIMTRAEMAEDKDSSAMYKAASDMMKNAISAKSFKMKARLEVAKMMAKTQAVNDENLEELEAKLPDGTITISRSQLLGQMDDDED